MMWKSVLVFGVSLSLASAQCGYDCEENSIEYSGDGGAPGLPPTTILGGKVTKLDEIAPIIFLNRTKAALNCASGVMQIDLKFEEPFYGIVYADFDRSSSCSVVGRGNKTARIDLPLKGCGTKQEPVRVFTNNIVVRFHPSLEIDGDEVITIVCRYPPPVAPPPPPFPKPLQVEPAPIQEQPLKGFQILMIICGILFLSLVLFGLAVSYYCLKNQKIRVVRKYPTKEDESLKGTGSTMSMFDTLKIPRAHAMVQAAGSTVSETPHGSETLPSDYPSESPSTAHSEVEDADSRRRSISSGGSYDNKAYVPDISVITREQLQRRDELETATHETVTRHFMPPPPPQPRFDVQMRIKKPPLPPPTPSSSSSETESVITQERGLLSTRELEESMEMMERGHTFIYRPDIHAPPQSPPVVYSEVTRRRASELEEEQYFQRELSPIAEDVERQREEVEEPPVVPSRRPEITSHVVDDVFLRTITEKKTIEDIERHRRQVTEYHARPPTKWDVTIRNYPDPNAPPLQGGDETATDWESFSEGSSIYGIPAALSLQRESDVRRAEQYRSTLEVPVPHPVPHNWNALVKVLESPEEFGETYRSEQVLTLEDKKKWRQIITTESTLRTMLTEATVREDYERIRRDHRYENLFEPEKWDTIIRMLSPPGERMFDQRAAGSSNRYRRKAEWDTRSNRRNSLPTLYEYESDGSSVRHLNLETSIHGGFDPLMRSRRTSRSSFKSDTDVRSMSEVTVDFARQDVPDNVSDGSSYYRPRRYYEDEDDEERGSLVRSLSQPSLVRSASEFTETWGLRRNWDLESPDHSPRSSVRSRTTGSGTAFATIKKSSFYQRRRDFSENE